jgi:hypothetical protein
MIAIAIAIEVGPGPRKMRTAKLTAVTTVTLDSRATDTEITRRRNGTGG